MSKLQSIIPKTVSFDDLYRVHGLGVIPILNERAPDISPLEPLEVALAKGAVTITETSGAGEVPFLLLKNGGDDAVILLDGEEVVGGKQNRIINTTLVISAHSTVKIPVSCVQAGRWKFEKSDFQSAKSVFRSKSRAVQKATVTDNVRKSGSFHSNQNAVWDQVSNSLSELGVESKTRDFSEARERVAHRIDEFVKAIRPAESQVGAIFITSKDVLGLEMVATPALFSKLCEKVVRSFAFEVLDAPSVNGISVDRAPQWWEKIVQSPFTRHKSPAAGEDIRLNGDGLVGSGLIWNETLIHFSCFPMAKLEGNRPKTKRSSVSDRRRNMTRFSKDA